MVATVATNPFVTTVGQGLFSANATTNGLVQGTAYPDPSTRISLRRGWLALSETIPMWGGVAIYENVPGFTSGQPNQALGVQVGRATSILGGSTPIAGFSVFDQAYAMVNSPASPVPLAPSYGQVNSYALGSGARVAVACDPGLVSAWGGPVGSGPAWQNVTFGGGSGGHPPITWDLTNQILIPYINTGTTQNVSAVSYAIGTGLVTLTTTAPVNLSPGDSVFVANIGGTGSFASCNGGPFTTVTGTTGSTVIYQIASGLTMTTTAGGTTTVKTGTTPLPAALLEVQASGCMTVAYTTATNTAAWNFSGACAVIQLI